MNLRDLGYLVAVAEERHFGRAAEVCFVSQPTLSTQIKKLEQELGVELIERNPGQVMLTDAGERVVERARIILGETENIRSIARQAQDPESGSVRLGLFPTIAPYLLPHVVPQLHHRFPNLELLLVEEKTEVVLERLRDGAARRGGHRAAGARGAPARGVPVRRGLRARGPVRSPARRAARSRSTSRCSPTRTCCCSRRATASATRRSRSASSPARRSAAGSARRAWRRCARWWRRESASRCCRSSRCRRRCRVSDDITLMRFADPAPTRRIAMLWRETSVYREFLPKLAEVIRSIAPELVHHVHA